jgi:hypothetical protein
MPRRQEAFVNADASEIRLLGFAVPPVRKDGMDTSPNANPIL